jgi:hypothetical protein
LYGKSVEIIYPNKKVEEIADAIKHTYSIGKGEGTWMD